VQTVVFSRTLRQQDYPNVTIVSENPEQALADLSAKPGKDIWLFGGGSLFRSLLEARLVDAVEVSVVPVLLGEGIPLLPPKPSSERFKLKLASSRPFKTGSCRSSTLSSTNQPSPFGEASYLGWREGIHSAAIPTLRSRRI
jgi:dihydrofolate reductase